MWVRVGAFRVKPGMRSDLRTAYNERALPRVRAQSGNIGSLLLEPETEGEDFLVLTLWQDRAAAQLYEDSGAAGEVVALVQAYFAGAPTLRSYESASLAGI